MSLGNWKDDFNIISSNKKMLHKLDIFSELRVLNVRKYRFQ